MYQVRKVCPTATWQNLGAVTFDLGAVTIDTEIPIRSLSPERMQVVVM
jgi:hypothetical protein